LDLVPPTSAKAKEFWRGGIKIFWWLPLPILNWAYGGSVPHGLEHLVRFVSNVPEPKRRVEDFIDA
jgi:hypothetical protein